VVSDHRVHVAQGGPDRCGLHAHALGAAGDGICHFGADAVVDGALGHRSA